MDRTGRILWAAAIAVACLGGSVLAAGTPTSGGTSGSSTSFGSSSTNRTNHARHGSTDQPNFVLVLTDDLDWTLGGSRASTLGKTRRVFGSGRILAHWYAQTPVCCPSRAELLTGRLFHNLRVANATASGCMHVAVDPDDPDHPFWSRYHFSNHFRALGYSVGIFGKHLNPGWNPTAFCPPGVDEVLYNGGGSYLDPSFYHGRAATGTIERVAFDNCTNATGMPCYTTSVVGNASLAWIARQVQQQQQPNDRRPFFAVVSVKAPHIQDGPGFPKAIPAPWHSDAPIPEVAAPRIPSYNASGTHHHWLVRQQDPLTLEQAREVDDLYVSRLRTLLSVDDLVQELVDELERLEVLNTTYLVFTSDHGYRLGQFRIPMCKLHPYENDLRVPMMIRGPGIAADTHNTFPRAVPSHAHLLPTLLGLAHRSGSQDVVPDTMDGTNLAGWLVGGSFGDGEAGSTKGGGPDETKASNATDVAPPKASSSNSISLLVEYASLGDVKRYQHRVDTFNHSFVALRILPADPGRWGDDTIPTRETEALLRGTVGTAEAAEHDAMQKTKAPPNGSNALIESIANLKYVEFRDSRVDWTHTKTPPLERELFDLDADPYELDNLLADDPTRVAPALLRRLEQKVQRLVRCRGATCREEHASGLDLDLDLDLDLASVAEA